MRAAPLSKVELDPVTVKVERYSQQASWLEPTDPAVLNVGGEHILELFKVDSSRRICVKHTESQLIVGIGLHVSFDHNLD